MATGRAILKLSDGTNEIDLLGARVEFKSRTFLLEDWRPQIAEWKGGGTWSQSALSDGRQLRYRAYDNVTETFSFKATDLGQDELIVAIEDLLAMLEQAADYWTAEWSETPVWLICRATEETNTRYALIHSGRVPEVEDYYRQPFIQPEPTCDAVMDQMTLIVERGHWQDTVPGEGNCLEIGTVQSYCASYPLVFDGDTSVVDLGSPAVLDNLPDFAVAGLGRLEVEAWVKADGWGEGNAGIIAAKNNNDTVGWNFDLVQAVGGLGGRVRYGTTDANSRIGTDEWTPDGEWHHLLFQYSEVGDRTLYIAVDGSWATSYSTQIASVGNYTLDDTTNLYLGNQANGTRGFDGEIGWLRVSFNFNYIVGVNFTPPPRCPLPGASGRWLGIHEGTGTTINDLSGNGNNGTASNTTWGDCCEVMFYGNYLPASDSREETCAEAVFVANKHNLAQLTHLFVEDGGVFGGNLLAGDPPYSLLPAVPAVNDRVYFGIQSTIADSGPFCSLVFDLSQAQADVADIVWEYWNGAWVALTVQDNTDANGAMTGAAFDTTGVRSVHWIQPSDWTTTTVNAVTGYWVRAEVQDAGTQPPIQQNRHVYSIVWPYVEVLSSRVGGTLANLLELYLHNQSDNDLGATAPELFGDRVVIGLRSYSRGADFSAYCNLSDEQQPGGWSVAQGGVIGGATYSFQNDIRTPTGRKLQCLNAAAGGDFAATITTDGVADSTYFGTFHTFMRGYQYNGAAGDIEIQLRGRVGGSGSTDVALTEWTPFANLTDWEVLDLGVVHIPFVGDFRTAEASASGNMEILVHIRGNGATDCDLYDVIWMPVDEWAIDTYDAQITTKLAVGLGDRRNGTDGYYLDIDSVTKPKSYLRSILKDAEEDTAVIGYRVIANGPAILQANARQRLWFFQRDVTISPGPTIGGPFEIACTVQTFNVQRYLSARGDR